MLQDAKSVLITGGCGTLGKAILRRSVAEKWECQITVFSTDAMKHLEIKKHFPHVHSVIGDVRDPTTVYNVMAGKDYVIHAAAVKHIPVSEVHSIDTYQINVEGSINIADAAIKHGVKHVIGISTDKVCHAANAYGSTKYMMEKAYQEYARLGLDTEFHLVRYGNVLESTGSVIEIWKNHIARGEAVKIVNPEMTRFFISPSQAVELILLGLRLESGMILIPKMKSLSLAQLARYTIGEVESVPVPMRPGEKMHETLLTLEECDFTKESDGFFFLHPTTSERNLNNDIQPYTSENAPRLTEEELKHLLADV